MRKVLLSAAALAASTAMFAQVKYTPQVLSGDAQYTVTETSFPGFYTKWAAKQRNTLKETNSYFVFDYTVPTLCDFDKTRPAGNNKRTDFWQWETTVSADKGVDKYVLSYDAKEKALKVVCNIAEDKAAIDPKYGDNNGGFKFCWVDTINGGDKAFNPFTETTDSVVGPMLDLSAKSSRHAVVHYKLDPTTPFDSVALRMDLIDANGRSSNGNSPTGGINKVGVNGGGKITDSLADQASTTYDGYLQHYFTWGNKVAVTQNWNNWHNGMGDWYSGDFWGIGTGRWWFPAGEEAKYPFPGKWGNGYSVELDARNIVKFEILPNTSDWSTRKSLVPPVSTGGKFTFWIKEVAIGDEGQDAEAVSIEHYIKSGKKEFFKPVSEGIVPAQASVVAPTVGKKFNFKGEGKMYNVDNQVVAAGVDGIDASDLNTGVYYIVVNGVSTTVSVQ